jgi:hypothetical protein
MSNITEIHTVKHTPNSPIWALLQYEYIPLNILAVSVLILPCLFITAFSLKFILLLTYTLFLMATPGNLLHTVSLNNPNLFFMPLHSGKFPCRLILYSIDVIKIYECSASTAARKIKEARDHYQKKTHQDITIKEFCEYFSIDYNETITICKLWQS